MDAVFAIAITIPVVELHAPKPEGGRPRSGVSEAGAGVRCLRSQRGLDRPLLGVQPFQRQAAGEDRPRLQSAEHRLSGCRQHHSVSCAAVGRTPRRRCGEHHRHPMVSGRGSDTGDLVVSSLGIRHRERSSRSKADRGLSSPPYHQIWPNCRCLLGGIRLGILELACWTDRRGDRDVELHRSASKAHLQARPGTGEWLRLGIDPARWMLTSANQSRILSIVIGKDRIRLPVA